MSAGALPCNIPLITMFVVLQAMALGSQKNGNFWLATVCLLDCRQDGLWPYEKSQLIAVHLSGQPKI